MTLITPSSLNYILSLSIISRLLVWLIQFVGNILLANHNADAYRNRYYMELESNSTIGFEVSNKFRYIYKSIDGFTRWDAQYFLEISKDGYAQEQHLAFLPLFPVLISFIRKLLFDHDRIRLDNFIPTAKLPTLDPVISINELETYIKSAVVGFVLNNFILFPIASVFLFLLTKQVKNHDEKYAKRVVWWFCFNPASIFFSACYTESLFAALTFAAAFLLEYKLEYFLSKSNDESAGLGTEQDLFKPLEQFNRIFSVTLPSMSLLVLGTATRSNALVSIGFIGYQFLLKWAPIPKTNMSDWTPFLYLCIALEFIQDILVTTMFSLIAASGYITFQIYSYILFCTQETVRKGNLRTRPDWCGNFLPHPYGLVQAKYWNVGLFRYYELKQLPNFILALPMSCLIVIGSYRKLKSMNERLMVRRQLVYYMYGLILTMFCGLAANVQITTRLLAASCPAVYWICADASDRSRLVARALKLYFGLYFVLGTLLHVNFYPWT